MSDPRAEQIDRAGHPHRAGYLYALSAYGLWGVLPIYFKQLGGVTPTDIVAHRVVWSILFLAVLLTIARGWKATATAIRQRRTMVLLAATSILIGINWLLYIYAITSGHILAGSLGYYLNPFANILFGRFLLKERLTRLQWIAVAIAGSGVAVLATGALDTLWISLSLCVSFATYGLLRKIAAVDSLPGLAIETTILLPLAMLWLMAWTPTPTPMGTGTTQTALLMAAGVVSTTPLLFFTAAARRLPYSTMGMIQFIAPTLQFIIAVGLYAERVTPTHAIAFGCIWVALAIYLYVLVGDARRMLAEQ